MKKILFLLLSTIYIQGISQSLVENANTKFGNQDWEGAVKDYTKYLKKNKSDSSAWYSLAMSYKNLENYDKAIESFKIARQTNFNQYFVDFNLSKVYALQDDTKNMYLTLTKTAENGFPAYSRLKNDVEFADYKQDEQFKSILDQVELNAYPCLSGDNTRHFDFWIGEWEVFVNGNKVGDNSITRAPGGCAIHESYTTAGNYSGQSINFYSPVDKKWHQHWVGSGGDVYNYIETKKEEGMLQFVSEFMNAQGTISLSRLTFTLNDDGTVRQLFENSTDDGKTWTPGFDGLYKKRTSSQSD